MSLLQINVLFFDAGGTLLHPAEPVGETYAQFAAKHGAQLDATELQRGFHAAFRQLKNRPAGTVPRHGDDRAWWREVVRLSWANGAWPKHFPFEIFFAELYAAYAEPERWAVYPEVENVLETLHGRGFRLALISNWDTRLRRILDGHFLTPFFQEIFISTEIGWAKPAHRLYEHALRHMKAAPHEAMMIGDDAENDDRVPRELGWQTFLLDRPEFDLRKLLEHLLI